MLISLNFRLPEEYNKNKEGPKTIIIITDGAVAQK